VAVDHVLPFVADSAGCDWPWAAGTCGALAATGGPAGGNAAWSGTYAVAGCAGAGRGTVFHPSGRAAPASPSTPPECPSGAG
jgi:hypothetical protein